MEIDIPRREGEIDPSRRRIAEGIVNELVRLGKVGFVNAFEIIIEEDNKPDSGMGQMARRLQGAGLIEEGQIGVRQFIHLLAGYEAQRPTIVGLVEYLKTEGEENAS